MAFYTRLDETASYADWELDLSLKHASRNAKRNCRRLTLPTPCPRRVDSVCSDSSSCSSNDAADDHQKRSTKHGSKASTTIDHELEAHLSFNNLYNERIDLLRERPMSKATLYLLQTGQHPLTIDDDPTDALASRETLSREERTQLRQAKEDKMRSMRIVDAREQVRFAALRLDQPDHVHCSMQAAAAWEKEQASMRHEWLRLRNQTRIREKALDFMYDLRISLMPGGSAEFGDRKSCFPAYPKWQGAKKVRFNDVHRGTRVRWVDVENFAELAQAERYRVC